MGASGRGTWARPARTMQRYAQQSTTLSQVATQGGVWARHLGQARELGADHGGEAGRAQPAGGVAQRAAVGEGVEVLRGERHLPAAPRRRSARCSRVGASG